MSHNLIIHVTRASEQKEEERNAENKFDHAETREIWNIWNIELSDNVKEDLH